MIDYLGGEIKSDFFFSSYFHFPNFLNDQKAECMLNAFILNKDICDSPSCINFLLKL